MFCSPPPLSCRPRWTGRWTRHDRHRPRRGRDVRLVVVDIGVGPGPSSSTRRGLILAAAWTRRRRGRSGRPLALEDVLDGAVAVPRRRLVVGPLDCVTRRHRRHRRTSAASCSTGVVHVGIGGLVGRVADERPSGPGRRPPRRREGDSRRALYLADDLVGHVLVAGAGRVVGRRWTGETSPPPPPPTDTGADTFNCPLLDDSGRSWVVELSTTTSWT